MTEQALPLTTYYSGWDGYQRSLVNIIAPLSPARLALRAAPYHWSIGVIAQNLVANRAWQFHGWMGEGNADLRSRRRWAGGHLRRHINVKERGRFHGRR
jgi:hypothetical protein